MTQAPATDPDFPAPVQEAFDRMQSSGRRLRDLSREHNKHVAQFRDALARFGIKLVDEGETKESTQ